MNSEAEGALGGAVSGAEEGSFFGLPGAAVGALGGAALGYLKGKSRPKYKVNPQYTDNVALAEGRAFGTNTAIDQGNNQLDQDQAEGINNAQRYSSSASSILNTLSSLTGKKMQSQRALVGDNAQLQVQGANQLQDANRALAEENDKAWNYNNNMPYQNMVEDINKAQPAIAENLGKRKDLLASLKALGLGDDEIKSLGMGFKVSRKTADSD